MRCRTAFTFTNRKHHCRNCGNTFCGTCSAKAIPLPHIGIVQPVRVCDGCHAKIKNPKPSAPKQDNRLHKHKSASMQPRNARIEDDDDEDLKRALAMSLEDVKASQPLPPYSSRPAQTTTAQTSKPVSKPTPKPAPIEEEEDEELKAAIAASLRDMEQQKARSAWSNPNKVGETAREAAKDASSSQTFPRPDHELSPVEAENINLFATLVDRLQTQPPGTILREPQIQELYESIGSLRPKLARTFGETMSKYGML